MVLVGDFIFSSCLLIKDVFTSSMKGFLLKKINY
jgi:hypothetical protein